MADPDLGRRDRARQWAAGFRGGRLIELLRAEGVEPVLLKGAAFAARLYDEDEWRPSVDLDLLVIDSQRAAAERVLRREGFEPFLLASDTFAGDTTHADDWIRRQDGFNVDLHRSLPGLDVPRADLWAALSPHLAPLEFGGVQVSSLDDAGLCFVAAVAAAHEGPRGEKARADLERATRVIAFDEWRRAASLAREADALEAFAVGLHLADGGRMMLDRLGLEADVSAKRRRQWDAPHLERAVAALRAAPSPLARVTLLARVVFPAPRGLRASDPVARRGPAGLALAYARRPLRLLRIASAQLRYWRG